MRLPFKSPPDAAAGIDAVQAARTQARRRLVGALVLLVAGVIGFPLLFETTPRPVALDTPIVMSPRGGAPTPPPRPAARPDTAREPVVEPARPAASAPAPAAARDRVTAEATPPEAAPAKPVPDKPATATPRTAPASAPLAVARSTPSPVAAPPAPAPAPVDDAARARALLEGKAAPAGPTPASAAAPGGRFVVQVGAFSDATTLREARDRVERLGLKTYTQVVEVEGNKRTRLRVGPFSSRDEAQAAAGKLKGAGLPANVLTL